MRKSVISGIIIIAIITTSVAFGAQYSCPSPEQVNGIGFKGTVGIWTQNGSKSTISDDYNHNEYLQCGRHNPLSLSGNKTRLLCCYTGAYGVFFTDVPYGKCIKQEQSFTCD